MKFWESLMCETLIYRTYLISGSFADHKETNRYVPITSLAAATLFLAIVFSPHCSHRTLLTARTLLTTTPFSILCLPSQCED